MKILTSGIILFVLLFATGCDKVKDTPEPDQFQSITLQNIESVSVVNGNIEVDLVSANGFTTDISLRITVPPVNGTLLLDEGKKVFVYRPNVGFSGKDSAIYEACKSSQPCKNARIVFSVVDTSTCYPSVSPYNQTVFSGESTVLNLPELFGCDGSISSILNIDAWFQPYISLTDGKIVVSLPDSQQAAQTTFGYRVCSPAGICVESTITIFITNPCADLFAPQDDVVQSPFFVITKSVPVSFVLQNDSSCAEDIIPGSIEILTPPSAISHLPGQPAFVRLKRDTSGFQPQTIQYRVKSRSGLWKTARIFWSFTQ